MDLVVADCAVFGALMAAKASGVRCAALMPTVYVAGPPRGTADDLPVERVAALADINRARGPLR